MSRNQKNMVDQELRKQIIPHIKRMHEVFGGRKQICVFLDCHYHHITKCLQGLTVLRPREARMVEYVTQGDITFFQLRPDLHMDEDEIAAECEAGLKRYQDFMLKPMAKFPMLARINENG